MKTQEVLVTDHVHPHLLEGLRQLGYGYDYDPNISLAETIQQIDKYQGVVINSKIKANASFIEKAELLKFIARLGSGLDIIDLPAAAAKGIAVLSAPEGNCNAVAEHAIGMLLSMLNNLRLADQEVRQSIWNREKHRGIEITGKTVGILGIGHTGQAFAKKLLGFDCNIVVYDRFVSEAPPAVAKAIKMVPLQELQAESDVVSLHVSLNPSSYHLVDSKFFTACSKPIFLVNTSRGKTVKLADLIKAIDQGKVLGAALDVFENEKPITYTDDEKALYSQLYQSDKVILTPHVAGWTHESKWKIADVLLRKIQSLQKKASFGHK